MSDYLGNLIARSRGDVTTIRPRLLSRFESTSEGLETPVAESVNSTENNATTERHRLIEPARATSTMMDRSIHTEKPFTKRQFTNRKPLQGDNESTPTDTRNTNKESDGVYVRQPPLVERVHESVSDIQPHLPGDRDFETANTITEITPARNASSGQSMVVHPGIAPASNAETTSRKSGKSIVDSSEGNVVAGVSAVSQAVVPANSGSSEPVASTKHSSTVVRVNIGRIEVRAGQSQQQTPGTRKPQRPRPVLSLPDYMKQRMGG